VAPERPCLLIATQLGQTLLSNARSPVVFVTSVASAGALVVANTPGVSQFFGCTPLGPAAWGVVLASAATADPGQRCGSQGGCCRFG
jgi:cation-transporting P-type ATPase I